MICFYVCMCVWYVWMDGWSMETRACDECMKASVLQTHACGLRFASTKNTHIHTHPTIPIGWKRCVSCDGGMVRISLFQKLWNAKIIYMSPSGKLYIHIQICIINTLFIYWTADMFSTYWIYQTFCIDKK